MAEQHDLERGIGKGSGSELAVAPRAKSLWLQAKTDLAPLTSSPTPLFARKLQVMPLIAAQITDFVLRQKRNQARKEPCSGSQQ